MPWRHSVCLRPGRVLEDSQPDLPYSPKVARKVKARSKTRSSRKAVDRSALGEILAELESIEADLRTSTVTFCKERLHRTRQRLAGLLDGGEEGSS